MWFWLPLILTVSCLAIARIEVHPYTRSACRPDSGCSAASPAPDAAGDDRTYLTSVAVRGVRAVDEPELRAAFAHRDRSPERQR